MQAFQSPWTPQSPKFEFEMIEEQPVHSILTTLHATDADSTIGEYQLVDDAADNGNRYFEINNMTGKQHECHWRCSHATEETVKFVVKTTQSEYQILRYHSNGWTVFYHLSIFSTKRGHSR